MLMYCTYHDSAIVCLHADGVGADALDVVVHLDHIGQLEDHVGGIGLVACIIR